MLAESAPAKPAEAHLPTRVSAAGLQALNAELTRQSRLLEITLGSISQGIFMSDAEGRVSTYNARVCELLDLPVSLMETRPTIQEVTLFQLKRGDFGDDANMLSEVTRPHVAAASNASTPEAYMQATRAGPAAYLRKTHTGRVLEVKTQQLPSGAMVRTFADVTDYVEADQARSRLRLLLEATQSMAGVGGWEVDFVSGKVFWTEEMFRMLDTTAQTYTPSLATSFDFFTPASAKRIKRAFAEAKDVAEPLEMDLEMVTATGRRIWVQSKSTATVERGLVVKRTTVMQDITERKRAEAALRANEANLRQMTSQVPGMVYQVQLLADGSRKYHFVSDGVRELYGVEPEDVLANATLLESFRHPDDRVAVGEEMRRILASGAPLTTQFRLRFANGRVKWVEISSSGVSAPGGGFVRSGVMMDVTARKRAEAELMETEALWKLALDSTGDGVWDWHIQTGVETYSTRYLEMYGFKPGELANLAEASDARTHPDDVEQMLRDRRAHFDGQTPAYINEHRIRCKDGSYKWILSRGAVIARDADGKPLRMVGTHTDITGRKQAETLIWRQANFDALTGLPNRRMLRDRLEQDIKKCRRDGLHLAILFIDLDHFKEVNDTLGHDKGDQLLVEAARRICTCVRDSDTVARMGGDEFTVVLPDMRDAPHLEQLIQAILRELATVFQLDDEQVFVSASVGITVYPLDGAAVETLFKNADQALYVAKGAGRNRFRFFTPQLQEAAQNRLRLTQDLRTGLAQQQFSMVYQPIIELASGSIYKAEALMRWHHPVRGPISPTEFIPIAEACGVIVDMGDWAFDKVARQVHEWRSTLAPQFQISVNKSPVQFHHVSDGHSAWLSQLDALGLPGSAIAVDITEGLLLDATEEVSRKLLQLRETGIQVSLDDFGTGYSALSYLQKFDIDFIKIDRQFVRHLAPGSTDLALCKAIIVMAHALGLKVIAEGIETAQQRQLLQEAGCDFGQGFLFAHPMPAKDFERMVLAKRSQPWPQNTP
jgi:diguanylate cyclase (GGDEF)-like protein/PAS domain S-box-containing protein